MTDQQARQRAVLEKTQAECELQSGYHKTSSTIYSRRAARLTVINLIASILIIFFASNEVAISLVSRVASPVMDKLNLTVGNDKNQKNEQISKRIGEFIIAFLGAAVVATAAIQYVFRYEERNLVHKYTYSDYDNLARKVRRLLASDQISDDVIHRVNKQLNYLSRHCPPISEHVIAPGFMKTYFGWVFERNPSRQAS